MSDAAEADKSRSGKKWATVSSAVLWIVGFILLLVIPAESPLVWVSDALLLLGFFPLLILWKPSWPWLVFGVLNVVIGFVLLVATYLPVESLTSEMAKARQQLVESKSPYAAVFSEASAAQMAHVHTHVVKQHSPWTWMIFGVVATIYGCIRMIKNTIKWVAQKKRTE